MKNKNKMKSAFTFTQSVKGRITRKFAVTFKQKDPVTFCNIYEKDLCGYFRLVVSAKTVCRTPDVFDSVVGKTVAYNKAAEKLSNVLQKRLVKEYAIIEDANCALDWELENRFESFIRTGR